MAWTWRRRTALLATATTLALTGIGGVTPAGAQEAEPPVPPPLTAEPTTNLHEGQQVSVFTPGEDREWPDAAYADVEGGTLRTAFCRAVPTPDLEADCIVGPSRTDVPVWSQFEDRATRVGIEEEDEVVVHRYLPLPSGLHDCRTSPCTLSLVFEDVMSERVPLSFGPEWEQWPSPQAFVDSVLAPLPRRTLSAAERRDLVDELEEGPRTSRELVVALASEPQVDLTIGEATRQYVAFFGRRPETGGLTYWVDRLQAGLPADQVARFFGGSAEARATYAGMTSGQIVDRLYAAALGRAPEADGRAYWVARLDAGLPLWKLVWHVARSAEYRTRWADQVLATKLRYQWQGEGPNEDAWIMGGAMYAWVGLGWSSPPGVP